MILAFVPTYATENKDDDMLAKYVTTEKPIPALAQNELRSSNQNLIMQNWIVDTKEYLEQFHGQLVESIVEDEEKVTFFFETKYMLPEEQVEEVAYYKPNSVTRAVYGDVKITTLSNWSNGAVPVDVDYKTASNLASAASILIGLSKQANMYMNAFVSAIAAYTGWKIDSNLPIKAESRAAAKYTRKVGSYYLSTNTWYPSVQIGKVQYWYYHTAYQQEYTGGPYFPYHHDNTPNGDETNYNAQYVKNHYHYNDWITNKVIELGDSGKTYVDVYG